MNTSRVVGSIALVACGVALSGCITLFPKASPVQLYRFGDTPAPVKSDQGATPFNLHRAPVGFEHAAQSDAILTTTGNETAYLASSRWVAPAAVLFDEAVDRAFNAAGGPARLVPRGEMRSGGVSLRLDVESFEARYSGARDQAPTIVVRVHGLLVRGADRSLIAEQVFEASKPADANRVSAIAGAFDEAAAAVIGQIVAWTESRGEATALASARG